MSTLLASVVGSQGTVDGAPPRIEVRDTTFTVLDALSKARDKHFFLWADERKGPKRPPGLTQQIAVAYNELHQAALDARAYAATNPALLEAERLEISRRHAETSWAYEQLTESRAKKLGRTDFRDELVAQMRQLFSARGAAAIAVGWPHRLEPVRAKVIRLEQHNASLDAKDRTYEDVKGLYHHSYSLMNTAHMLLLPNGKDHKRHEDDWVVEWTPTQGKDEAADPSGSIPLWLLSDPDKSLPVPFSNFPKEAELGLLEFKAASRVQKSDEVTVMTTGQESLFGVESGGEWSL